jgi:cytochrome c-type biogenesis protein CcmH
MTPRRWSWLAVLVVIGVALIIGVSGGRGARDNSERIDALSKQIRCLACPGESVFESRVPFAINVRNEIARRVAGGETDSQIKQALVDSYPEGEKLLLQPRADGATSLLWVLPVLVLVCGGSGLALAFRRWHQEASMVPDDADRHRVAMAMMAMGERSVEMEDDPGAGSGIDEG